jgi:hypothetical protein
LCYLLAAGHSTAAAEETALGNIVNLRNTPVELTSDIGHAFVVDATRAAEGLITDKELAEKYELSPADWRAITKDKALGHAIRAERERRVRNGEAARESAQKIFVRAPQVLGSILDDQHASPRHRIESARELRTTAANSGSESATGNSEKFIITINLGADHIEHYEKTIAPMRPMIEDKANDNE